MAIRICPHCYASMQRCVRDGVMMDLCIQCGGIFLDGGELEYLVAAATVPLACDAHHDGDKAFLGGDNRYGREESLLDTTL